MVKKAFVVIREPLFLLISQSFLKKSFGTSQLIRIFEVSKGNKPIKN